MILQKEVIERVAEAIKTSAYKKEDIGRKLNVSYATIHRWSKKEKKGGFKESEIKALSEALNISFDWLMYGDEKLNQIESAVNEAGINYKGLDQTVSSVKLKAESLKQDLQSLIDDLDSLKKK